MMNNVKRVVSDKINPQEKGATDVLGSDALLTSARARHKTVNRSFK